MNWKDGSINLKNVHTQKHYYSVIFNKILFLNETEIKEITLHMSSVRYFHGQLFYYNEVNGNADFGDM